MMKSKRNTKYIFVTGGVVSSLGKGLAAASIARILEGRGFKVTMQKLDPYINVDPGTMSPFQHGEVYVTDDGTEADLDLGHYERFTHARVNKDSNYTTGKIYKSVIQKERRGDYLGKTVQVIPHITDEIKAVIRGAAGGADVRHQREVHVNGVLAAHVLPELADGFEERQALDVAHGAADLDQHDIDVAPGLPDTVLDFVGNVGDHLYRAAQVIAAAFLLDDRHVDLAGGPVAVAGRGHAGEPLVVAQVEVGLGPIVGDVDLAVLVRAHRPGIDVDVRVELLQRDLVAVALEQRADRGGGQALAK